MTAVGPVELIKIDVIGPEPLEAGVHRLADSFRRDRFAVADVRTAGAGDLGGNDHIVAPAARRQPIADNALGVAVGLGRKRRGRVEFGRIDEVDAPVEGIVELFVGLDRRVLRAPCHRPEADG